MLMVQLLMMVLMRMMMVQLMMHLIMAQATQLRRCGHSTAIADPGAECATIHRTAARFGAARRMAIGRRRHRGGHQQSILQHAVVEQMARLLQRHVLAAVRAGGDLRVGLVENAVATVERNRVRYYIWEICGNTITT